MRDKPEDFVHGLTEDLQIARALGKLAFHLREMVVRKTSLVRLSDDFVWLALRAARDDAVIHLWKVFDTSRRARSLLWFVRRYSRQSPELIRRDLERLSTESSDVRRLKLLRNEIFAHRTLGSPAHNEAVLLKHNLSEDEFLKLIVDAHQILRVHWEAPLSLQVIHDEDDAIDQLLDLDVFLGDTIRGRWGLERLEFESDGSLRFPRGMLDDRAWFSPGIGL